MASLRNHIDQHCKECVYDKDGEGGWKQQVAKCSGLSCKLYLVRPLPVNKKHEDYPMPPAKVKDRGQQISITVI